MLMQILVLICGMKINLYIEKKIIPKVSKENNSALYKNIMYDYLAWPIEN